MMFVSIKPFNSQWVNCEGLTFYPNMVDRCMCTVSSWKDTHQHIRWRAHYSEESDIELIAIAARKLIVRNIFNPDNKYETFSVLSKRICLKPVMATSESKDFVDRAIAHHMRLFTGYSLKPYNCFSYSPSEPLLALGAAKLLYDTT